MSAQPISLGALIDALNEYAPDKQVYFDFCGVRPGAVASYRGYYDHLAISPSDKPRTVRDLVDELAACVGKVFEGYKGGDFRMTRDTPMWVSPYGESHSTAVTGVVGEYDACITTGYCEDWNGGTIRAMQVLGGLGFGNAGVSR